jgi:serine phosphatase RsbU (regulator of sigma subunit)/prefoldin subunit 5
MYIMKALKIILICLISVISYAQTDTTAFNKAREIYQDQKYVEAIESFEKYLSFEKDKQTIADCYHYIGISYYMLGDHEMASKSISLNLEIHKKLGNEEGVGNAYNNLGAIYDVQKKYNEALNYYQKSLEVAEKLNDTVSIAASLNNIASAKINIGDNDGALIDLANALNINEEYDQSYAIILNHRNIGNAYNNLGNLDKALSHHEIALQLSLEMDHQQTISAAYENIGEDYIALKDYDKAIVYLKKSYKISNDLNLTYYKQVACKYLSEAYEAINMPDSSLKYYKIYSVSKDSVFSKENQEYTSYLDVKYKTKEKENEILKMKHEDEIQKHKIEHQKTANRLLTLIASISLIAIVIIMIFYKRIKKEFKENIRISKVLKSKNDDINDSINYAKNIQHGILSTADKFKKNVPNSFIMFRPKDVVSGDFYWTLNKDDKQYFAAVDCTGHGVPGAMMSIIGHTGLTRSIREHDLEKPSEILSKLNLMVSSTFDKEHQIRDGMDLSLCMIDKNTNILTCSSANNPVYIVRDLDKPKLDYKSLEFGNKVLYKIDADKQYIGSGKLYEFTDHEIQLEKGDGIYIFSDGFADQFGGDRGKKYKYRAFQKFLMKISDLSDDDQLKALNTEFNNWIGDFEQIDDVLVIGVKI